MARARSAREIGWRARTRLSAMLRLISRDVPRVATVKRAGLTRLICISKRLISPQKGPSRACGLGRAEELAERINLTKGQDMHRARSLSRPLFHMKNRRMEKLLILPVSISSVPSIGNHELSRVVVRLIGGLPGPADLQIAPAQRTIDADHGQHHPRARTLDADFHEALKVRRAVEVEDRRQRFDENGQAPKRRTHHHAGHFQNGVSASSFARSASVRRVERVVGEHRAVGPIERGADAQVRASPTVDEVMRRLACRSASR